KNGDGRARYRLQANHELFDSDVQLRDPDDAVFVTAEQAIDDLEFLKAGERCDSLDVSQLPGPRSEYQRRMRMGLVGTLTNTSVPRINEDTKLRLAKLPPGGNFRDLPHELTERYLTGALWGPSNGSGKLGRRH